MLSEKKTKFHFQLLLKYERNFGNLKEVKRADQIHHNSFTPAQLSLEFLMKLGNPN